jgi:glycosyltransferase involved in cell wall biosynthesis
LINPFLSVVFPAYNEENRLPKTLTDSLNFFESQSYGYEIIVVENGSRDHTLEVARQFEKQARTVRVLHENLRGKGHAVRTGMLVARGEHRFMADADLSMPIAEVSRFVPPQLERSDVAIGSRELQGSLRYDEPAYRHIGGRAINLLIRVLALPGLHDTQCGFKCFRAPVAEDLFRNQTLTGWSFDIELLYVARLRGYKIVEVPINWYFNPESKVDPVKDAFRLVADVLQIRSNARRGMYAYAPQRPAAAAGSEN